MNLGGILAKTGMYQARLTIGSESGLLKAADATYAMRC